ncbi:peptidylprolyl isomerase [Gammaproteobacteria bacterium]|nr:peptidylprolyl isomerase [Gammaproteobacteria bacterium]
MSSTLTLALVLNIGTVKITLNPEVAPLHVAQITQLVNDKAYDGITFHRVIDGFVAQVGDVKHGHFEQLNEQLVGTGGSDLPNIPAEFNDTPHLRGTVSMARSNHPDSANSQFFICLADTRFLDNQYTVFGQVTEGMDIVDKIKKGTDPSGSVSNPDYIINAYIES